MARLDLLGRVDDTDPHDNLTAPEDRLLCESDVSTAYR